MYMKKSFKKVLSLALAFAMSFAAFAPTMVKAADETDYAKVDFMKVTNQFVFKPQAGTYQT